MAHLSLHHTCYHFTFTCVSLSMQELSDTLLDISLDAREVQICRYKYTVLTRMFLTVIHKECSGY